MGRLTRAFGGAHAAKDVDAILRAALLAILDRDLDLAEELLTRAVRIDSTGVESYLALGRLFRMRGEIGRAIRIHQNLLLRRDLAADSRVAVLLDLAADFRQGGFLRRAIATYEEILAREPKNRESLRSLVRLLGDVREFERAIEFAKKLAKLEKTRSEHPEAELYVDMAATARAEGRIEDGRKAARRALKLSRENVRGWIVLGELEAERGRDKAALAAWKRVTGIDAGAGPQVYAQIEAALAKLGRPDDFEKLLREVLEGHPDDTGACLALARTLASRGDIDAALTQLRDRLERDPDRLEIHAAIARLLLSEGREAEACKEFAEVLELLDRQGLMQAPEILE
jgi:lipopolysaccharide biosynthesis regulator YciM